MRRGLVLAMVASVFLIAVTTGFARTADAGTRSFSTRLRTDSVSLKVKVTELGPIGGYQSYRIEVRKARGTGEGYIGLSSNADGTCYCGFLAASHFSVDGKAKDVLDIIMAWPNDQAAPCAVLLSDDDFNVVASAPFKLPRCR